MQTSNDITEPNYIRPELVIARDTLTLCDDLLGGTPQMHAKAATYIRQWPEERAETYRVRRVAAPCFEGLNRTLSASVGMLFSRAPVMTWGSSETALSPILDNADLAGTKYNVFAQQFAEASIKSGIGLLLVDYTSPPKGADGQPVDVHGGNERALNLRPKWSLYERASAICWNESVIDNRRTLQQLTLAETHADVLPGEFGATVRDRFRDLRLLLTPAGWQATWVLRELQVDSTGKQSWAVIDAGVFRNRAGVVADFLPVAIAYAGRKKATLVAGIPLAGTAYANKAHWLYATNLNFNREACAFETFVVIGDLQPDATSTNSKPVPGRIRVGPGSGVHMKHDGDVKWIAPSGTGNAQLKEGKEECLLEMDQQGLGFLVPGKAVQMTATGALIESTAQLATLTSAGEAIQDALNQALEYTAWYEGIEKANAPTIALHTKFDVKSLDAATAGVFSQMVAAGTLTLRTFLKLLVNYGVLPDGFDVEEEATSLEHNPPIVAMPSLNPSLQNAA